MNMKNGMNYARKVLQTGECSALILDEVLGLLDNDIISDQELISLINLKSEETDLILTGRVISDSIIPHVYSLYEIIVKKDE